MLLVVSQCLLRRENGPRTRRSLIATPISTVHGPPCQLSERIARVGDATEHKSIPMSGICYDIRFHWRASPVDPINSAELVQIGTPMFKGRVSEMFTPSRLTLSNIHYAVNINSDERYSRSFISGVIVIGPKPCRLT